MNVEKEQLLNETYEKFMEIGLNSPENLDILSEIAAPDIMGFGTAVDERIFSIHDLKDLLIRQKEQSDGMQVSWTISPVLRKVLNDENAAIYVDDIALEITANGDTIKMSFRYSSVMEYQDNKWACIHFHGSKPEYVLSEEDTWGIEEWKHRNDELEKLVKERTAELEKSIDDLKSTQAQLIQSEKMASLGELTAGIAHEIQNPLNFVNNFSEVSNELISELKAESLKVESERDKVLEDELLNDIAQNLEKINHHGKRASSIVKGMLEHSRKSAGTKELTDINALADEYLRLAYHGLRAKDKDFNATLETNFDPSLPKINIVTQDMGRVILNLITNAFYAVDERSKKGEPDYEPKVTLTTQLAASNHLIIAIKDNGSGIPDTIKDKIFQPFFTTKPTGQGTGLGLSLAYDIVKAHSGELKLETKEGLGSEFIIQLPYQTKQNDGSTI